MEFEKIGTPMIQQYMKLKLQCKNIKNYILFYRLGDFYEMFFEDAKIASHILNLTLTKKKIGNNQSAPMCGIPYHASENYINKLISLNYKVVICDQISNEIFEDEKNKLLKRKITKIITPGTFSSIDNNTKNNFIASIYIIKEKLAIIFADVNTGQIYFTNNIINIKSDINILKDEINKFNPSEILINNIIYKKIIQNIVFNLNVSVETLNNKFNNDILDNINLLKNNFFSNDENKIFKFAIKQLLFYCNNLKLNISKVFSEITVLPHDKFMFLNFSAIRNLEIFESLYNRNKNNTLFSILNSNVNTSMGSRLLKIILEKPLIDVELIKDRNNFVEEIINNYSQHKKITSLLKNINDIQRLITKIIYKSANAKDLINLKNSIFYIQKIKKILLNFNSKYAKQLCNELDINILENLFSIIDDAIMNDPPTNINNGYIFKEEYNNEIKKLRDLAKGGKDKILEIENNEKILTGIKNLKISYNKIFGYFIEITKGNLNLIPKNRYIRKQTLVNCERFITEQLKLHEFTVIEASTKLCELETKLFLDFLDNIILNSDKIQKIALSISYIDIMNSFAITSYQNNYIKPMIDNSEKIFLKDSKHPIIERIKKNLFVPNNVNIDTNKTKNIIITGPNMGGKSTYMRQIALIVIMAQIGCFVPATKARIGIVDRIYTRIGASDNLVNGESTFMLEMKEVVEIINSATKKSLVILDEIGRGTSTYDGLSIAKSILTFLNLKIKCKTFFATHYHELTDLELCYNGVKNCHVALKKVKNNIIFLYKIFNGAIKKSYGIEVAKLAGMNDEIIENAKKFLESYEKNNTTK